MPNDKEQYIALITEIIQKQTVILGPEIALVKARNVKGLVISDDGKVIDVQGDPQTVVEEIVEEYVNLSGQIVKNALGSVFAKYPSIKKVI